MTFCVILSILVSQAPDAKDAPKAPRVIKVDEENDGLPGIRVGPTRKEIEEMIVQFGRDPVSAELIDRVDALFRPRWSNQRRYDDARRRLTDIDFLGMIDQAAIEASDKPADTRAFLFRAAIEYENSDFNTLKEAVREDINRETAPRKAIKGRIVDDRNGKPIEGAVVASISGMMARTDSNGVYVLKTRPPKSTNPMSITIEAPGYALAQSYFAWDEMADEVTSDYRLAKAITFGGQVVDLTGKPISGAVLDLWVHNEAICRDGSMERVNFNTSVTLRTKTGPDGIYAFRNMPPDLPDRQAVISLAASHPDYLQRQKQYAQNEELGPGWQITLEPGCRVNGEVVDESGKPIANANVRVYTNNVSSTVSAVLTDSEGRFHIGGLPIGACKLAVQAPGLPPVTKSIMAKKDAPVEVKITAEAGFYLTGKVVGENNKPIKDATVGWLQALENDGKPKRTDMPTNRFTRTKDDGTFRIGPVAKGKYKITSTFSTLAATGSADAETGRDDCVIELKSNLK